MAELGLATGLRFETVLGDARLNRQYFRCKPLLGLGVANAEVEILLQADPDVAADIPFHLDKNARVEAQTLGSYALADVHYRGQVVLVKEYFFLLKGK